MIYRIEEIGDGTERGIRVIFHDGQTVAKLRGGNTAIIALSFENLRRQDERLSDEYMGGVIAGIVHMTLLAAGGLA